MTDTKPTPRTDAAVVHREYIIREMDIYSHKFVLADFARDMERELAAIKSQPVPVEPEYDRHTRQDTLDYIDSLQSALQVAQQERDDLADRMARVRHSADRFAEQAEKAEAALKVAQQEHDRIRGILASEIANQLKRAEKAEERNKQLVELLKALLGALKHPVPPTQKQWDAIGVVSDNILREVENG